MSIQQFHDTADQLIDRIHSFIEANVDNSWENDLTEAGNALCQLSATFNGVTKDDLTDPESDHQRVFLELDRATAEALIEAINIATESPRLSDQVVERAQEVTTRITDALVG
jgi:hypothetical protein